MRTSQCRACNGIIAIDWVSYISATYIIKSVSGAVSAVVCVESRLLIGMFGRKLVVVGLLRSCRDAVAR